MIVRFVALLGALTMVGATAQAQSVADLRAQYQQTQVLLSQGEAAGLDPNMLAMLRESLAGIKQMIDEMEREQLSASSSGSSNAEPEALASQAAPAEENLAAATCSRFGFTEGNYRDRALAPGNDLQIRTMCGQAYEYYTMYKRALAQRHPEASKTYKAHSDSALVVNSFYGEARALPGEGIQEDTRTAADYAAETAARQQAAAAQSPPRPPPAPPCKGCVTPQ